MKKPLSIDEYIAQFPAGIQELLQQVRTTVQQAAPSAKEVISYAMPAFKQNSVLVFFAANKNHIGFYPTGAGIEAFKDQLGAYQFSKGAIQFPLDKKMPLALIKKMVKFRVKQDAEMASLKKKK